MGAANLDTSEDRRYLNALGSKSYMAPISPAFFTYYGPSSWNKNWIYRSDNWLLATRFEDVISMRDKIDLIELITWNGA
jgi:glucan endo-1,3-alpha-glucosidase